MLPVLDDTRERGVHNPRVIDLIAYDQAADVVRLHLMEFRKWEDNSEQFQQLQEKFNNYLDYALDGHLVAQYPQYQGKKVRFVLECVEEPVGPYVDLIKAMRGFGENTGCILEVLVKG